MVVEQPRGISRRPEVAAQLAAVESERAHEMDAVKRLGVWHGDVIVFDRFDDLGARSPGFLGYLLFPQCLYAVSATRNDASIKISSLVLTNPGDAAIELTVTAYVEWSLGSSRVANAPFIVTTAGLDGAAVYARNPRNREFADRCAFLASSSAVDSLTCDRSKFLGRPGRLDAPAALIDGSALSGRAGAGFDPCATLQRASVFRRARRAHALHAGRSGREAAARAMVASYLRADVAALYERVTDEWDGVLGTLIVDTPDVATNFILNRWLLYQTRACRLFARAGFYQAGGAYGFRDQLQDVMALMVAAPAEARAHIVRASAHQFPQGDVQHWWHPPSGRGVRTRFPTIACSCRSSPRTTSQRPAMRRARRRRAVHRRPAGAADARGPLFGRATSSETASVRALRARSTRASAPVRTLPLMHGGDWNDGMNRVGIHGRGESVWLGWFLYATLRAFAPIGDARRRAHASSSRRIASARTDRNADAHGSAAPTSTTARRSAPHTTANAGSIRSRRAGRRFPSRQSRSRTPAMDAVSNIWSSAATTWCAVPAVQRERSRPWLHPGLPAWRARKRRPVHARGRVVRDRVRDAG
jgi:hypothetical protein